MVGQHQPRQKATRNSMSLTKKQAQETKESRIMQILLADRAQPTSSVLEKLKTDNPYAPASFQAKQAEQKK